MSALNEEIRWNQLCAVDSMSEGVKSYVTSLRCIMGDETVDEDIESDEHDERSNKKLVLFV